MSENNNSSRPGRPDRSGPKRQSGPGGPKRFDGPRGAKPGGRPGAGDRKPSGGRRFGDGDSTERPRRDDRGQGRPERSGFAATIVTIEVARAVANLVGSAEESVKKALSAVGSAVRDVQKVAPSAVIVVGSAARTAVIVEGSAVMIGRARRGTAILTSQRLCSRRLTRMLSQSNLIGWQGENSLGSIKIRPTLSPTTW